MWCNSCWNKLLCLWHDIKQWGMNILSVYQWFYFETKQERQDWILLQLKCNWSHHWRCTAFPTRLPDKNIEQMPPFFVVVILAFYNIHAWKLWLSLAVIKEGCYGYGYVTKHLWWIKRLMLIAGLEPGANSSLLHENWVRIGDLHTWGVELSSMDVTPRNTGLVFQEENFLKPTDLCLTLFPKLR